MCVAAVSVVLVGVTVGVRNSPTARFLGVSLLSIVSFVVNLDDLIWNWTSLETAIRAIHRIQSFSLTTPSEDRPGEDHTPPKEWPTEGQVGSRNVMTAYGQVFARGLSPRRHMRSMLIIAFFVFKQLAPCASRHDL